MQAWSDYLDAQRVRGIGAAVRSVKSVAA
jgi:hypothetical protein